MPIDKDDALVLRDLQDYHKSDQMTITPVVVADMVGKEFVETVLDGVDNMSIRTIFSRGSSCILCGRRILRNTPCFGSPLGTICPTCFPMVKK